MRARTNTFLLNVTMAAIILVVGLAGIEGYLRWQGAFQNPTTPGCYVFSDNPRLMYELAPHCDGTNALGMRDHEIDPAAHGTRIAALGDSITFGPGVAMSDTWPKRLQHDLRRLGADATVLNFGVQGYSTVQEVETLRVKALPLRPQVVVLQYFMNDEDIYTTIFDGMIADLRKHQGDGLLDAMDPRRGWLARQLRLSRTGIAIRIAWDRVTQAVRSSDPHENPITDYYRERSPVREGLTALGALATAHGLHVLVLVFPHAYGARADRIGKQPLPELSEYPGSWVFDNAKVFAHCAALGLDCVDVAGRLHADPRFSRLPGHRLFMDGCCHLTTLGHKVTAQIAGRELRARGWIDLRR